MLVAEQGRVLLQPVRESGLELIRKVVTAVEGDLEMGLNPRVVHRF
jgi:hypothetical protein